MSGPLLLLLACNLLKYADRQVLFPLLPLIQGELALSDAGLGMLATAFMVAYMVSAPLLGWAADRGSRPLWMAGSVALWSAAAAGGAISRGFAALLASRALAGAGQSGYTAVSTAFVAEHYSDEKRGRGLSTYLAAIPAGSALGFLLGGWLGGAFGWRWALALTAAPGLVLALWVAPLPDPQPERARRPEEEKPALADYRRLGRIPSYAVAVLAMAGLTFTIGGMAVWMPTFFTRLFGMSVAEAGTTVGAVTVSAGLLGTLTGGWLGDRLLARSKAAHLWVAGAGLLLSAPVAAAALLAETKPLAIGLLFAAQFLAFLQTAPLNAVIAGVVAPGMRSMAFAANIFIIHALGDAPSPALIGAASDRWGLRIALLGSLAVMAAAGLLCLWGTRFYAKDSQLQ